MQLHYSNTKRAEKRDDTAHFNDIIPHSDNRLWCKHEVLVDEVNEFEVNPKSYTKLLGFTSKLNFFCIYNEFISLITLSGFSTIFSNLFVSYPI